MKKWDKLDCKEKTDKVKWVEKKRQTCFTVSKAS